MGCSLHELRKDRLLTSSSATGLEVILSADGSGNQQFQGTNGLLPEIQTAPEKRNAATKSSNKHRPSTSD